MAAKALELLESAIQREKQHYIGVIDRPSSNTIEVKWTDLMRDCDDDILFWPPAFCFGQPATSPNYSSIAIWLKKWVFFLFPLGFSQEFLNVELFGPSTRDRKLLILGRFPRFRTVSVKVITTVTAGTVHEWADFGSGKSYMQPAGVAISILNVTIFMGTHHIGTILSSVPWNFIRIDYRKETNLRAIWRY